MRTRLLIDCACLVSVIFLPIWVTLVLIVLTCFRFRAFEVMFFGLILDFLWTPVFLVLPTVPWFTLFSIAVVWILEPLRRELLMS